MQPDTLTLTLNALPALPALPALGSIDPLDECGALFDLMCDALGGNLMFFDSPVDTSLVGLEDYFDVISFPMDLGTIRTRLDGGWYKPNGPNGEVRAACINHYSL